MFTLASCFQESTWQAWPAFSSLFLDLRKKNEGFSACIVDKKSPWMIISSTLFGRALGSGRVPPWDSLRGRNAGSFPAQRLVIEPSTVNSRLSLVGHPYNTTATKSPAKINYRRLTEINSRFYGLAVMRTLSGGPYSVRNKGSWLLCFTEKSFEIKLDKHTRRQSYWLYRPVIAG